MNKREQQRFTEEMQVRALSPRTVESYESSLKLFFDFYKGKAAKSLCVPEIKTFQRYLIEKEYSPHTVNRHLTAVRVFYRWVYERHHYSANLLPRVKAPRKQPVILSRQEVKRIIEPANKSFYKAVLMTLYSTGLRAGEVRRLKVTDIDRDRMVITVKKGKGDKDRQAFLSPVTLDHLEKYWKQDRIKRSQKSDYLFMPSKNPKSWKLNKHMSHTALGYIVGVAVKAANIKKRVTPHTFRHSFAVHLLEKGVSIKHIQYLLGHSNMRTTSLYLHIADIRNINVKSPLDDLLGGLDEDN
jgi:integrase/recombinase XerD